MSYFDNNNWQKWILVGLVVVNVISLGIMWTKPANSAQSKSLEEQRRKADQFLAKQLDFSEIQKAAFFKLSQAHTQKVKNIRGNLFLAKRKFFNSLDDPETDSAEVATLSQDIAKWQTELEQSTYYHFKAVRDLGDESQKEKFDQVILEALKVMQTAGESSVHQNQ